MDPPPSGARAHGGALSPSAGLGRAAHPERITLRLMTELLAFIGVAVLVIVDAGEDTALTVRNTLAGGRRAGIRTAAGVVCGQRSGRWPRASGSRRCSSRRSRRSWR